MITPFSSDRASRPVSANQYGNRFCRPQAAANERPIAANERLCMEPNETGQLGITRPKQNRAKKKERRITTQEALLFSQELRDEEKTGKIVAVWLALTTGIRRSEALALVWDDIDLEGKRLHARRQFGKEKTLDLLSRIRTSYHSWK